MRFIPAKRKPVQFHRLEPESDACNETSVCEVSFWGDKLSIRIWSCSRVQVAALRYSLAYRLDKICFSLLDICFVSLPHPYSFFGPIRFHSHWFRNRSRRKSSYRRKDLCSGGHRLLWMRSMPLVEKYRKVKWEWTVRDLGWSDYNRMAYLCRSEGGSGEHTQ